MKVWICKERETSMQCGEIGEGR